MEVTIRNCLLVALILLVATFPISNQLSLRHLRTRRTLVLSSILSKRTTPARLTADLPPPPADPTTLMPAFCRDPEVFNFCYACGRDINDVRVFNNCCGGDGNTLDFCIGWLDS